MLTAKDFRNTDLWEVYQAVTSINSISSPSGVKLTPIIDRNSGAIDLTALGTLKMVSFVNKGESGINSDLLGKIFKDGEIVTFNTVGSPDYLDGADFIGDGNGNDILIVALKQ